MTRPSVPTFANPHLKPLVCMGCCLCDIEGERWVVAIVGKKPSVSSIFVVVATKNHTASLYSKIKDNAVSVELQEKFIVVRDKNNNIIDASWRLYDGEIMLPHSLGEVKPFLFSQDGSKAITSNLTGYTIVNINHASKSCTTTTTEVLETMTIDNTSPIGDPIDVPPGMNVDRLPRPFIPMIIYFTQINKEFMRGDCTTQEVIAAELGQHPQIAHMQIPIVCVKTETVTTEYLSAWVNVLATIENKPPQPDRYDINIVRYMAEFTQERTIEYTLNDVSIARSTTTGRGVMQSKDAWIEPWANNPNPEGGQWPYWYDMDEHAHEYPSTPVESTMSGTQKILLGLDIRNNIFLYLNIDYGIDGEATLELRNGDVVIEFASPAEWFSGDVQVLKHVETNTAYITSPNMSCAVTLEETVPVGQPAVGVPYASRWGGYVKSK